MLVIIKSLLLCFFSIFFAIGLIGLFTKPGLTMIFNSLVILGIGVFGFIDTLKIKPLS